MPLVSLRQMLTVVDLNRMGSIDHSWSSGAELCHRCNLLCQPVLQCFEIFDCGIEEQGTGAAVRGMC
jgi:hypothetical protein